MAKSKKHKLRLTLIRSKFGRSPNHLPCLLGLGLRRIHQTVEVEDTLPIRGMIDKVSYLLKVEECS